MPVAICEIWGLELTFTFRMSPPSPGETRRKRKFLFLPKTFNGETRWLCFAEIFQIFSAGGSETGYDYTFSGWKNVGWGDQIQGVEIEKPRFSIFGGSISSSYRIIPKKDDPIKDRLRAIL